MRHFPNWLKAYMDYTAYNESPNIYHFWIGVGTVASALQRRVWVDELTYEIVPNFYIILVGPAGVAKKSTTINLGISLLEAIEGIHLGPESGSWQGVADALTEATTFFRINPHDEAEKPRPQSAITIAASELGTFLKTDDPSAIAFLTDVWDGRRHVFRHRTRHSGSPEIINPLLNIMAATTPAWIQNNVPENIIGEGFTSRTVFVYADQPRMLIARPSKLVRPDQYHKIKEHLIEDLKEIFSLAGPFTYSPEADRWMEEWYALVQDRSSRPPLLSSDRYNGYYSRKQTHLIKIAMVLSAAKRSTKTLEVEDFEEARVLLEETESFMVKVFDSIGRVDEAVHVNTLVSMVRHAEWISLQELWKLCYNTMSLQDFQAAVRSAVASGYLASEHRHGAGGLKAPSIH